MRAVIEPPNDVVYAQARFNVFRPDRWVTVAAGTADDVVRGASAGIYAEVVSPMGDTPYRIRVHTPESEAERAQAMADIAVTSAWGRVPAPGWAPLHDAAAAVRRGLSGARIRSRPPKSTGAPATTATIGPPIPARSVPEASAWQSASTNAPKLA